MIFWLSVGVIGFGMANLNNVIDRFKILADKTEQANILLEQALSKDLIGQRNDARDLSVLMREIASCCLSVNVAITDFMWNSWEDLESVNNNETEKA